MPLELPYRRRDNGAMPLRIRSSNTTPLGMLGSFLVAGGLTVAVFRVAWGMSSSFALAWWAAAAMFLAGMAAGQLLLIVREFTFDAASQSLTVRERWLGFIRWRPRSIGFAEIAAVYLQSRESVYPVVVLPSGKNLYPRWPGTPRQVNRYRAAVKRIAHVGRVSGSEGQSS